MRRIYTCIVIIFFILVSCFAGWLLCDIAPNETYTWYSGIWHGLFFFQNLILSWFTDALYKAEYYTTAYNVFLVVFHFHILFLLGAYYNSLLRGSN